MESLDTCCTSGGQLSDSQVCSDFDDYILGLRCQTLDNIAQDCAVGGQDCARESDGELRGHLIEYTAPNDPTYRVLLDEVGDIVGVWDDDPTFLESDG